MNNRIIRLLVLLFITGVVAVSALLFSTGSVEGGGTYWLGSNIGRISTGSGCSASTVGSRVDETPNGATLTDETDATAGNGNKPCKAGTVTFKVNGNPGARSDTCNGSIYSLEEFYFQNGHVYAQFYNCDKGCKQDSSTDWLGKCK